MSKGQNLPRIRIVKSQLQSVSSQHPDKDGEC